MNCLGSDFFQCWPFPCTLGKRRLGRQLMFLPEVMSVNLWPGCSALHVDIWTHFHLAVVPPHAGRGRDGWARDIMRRLTFILSLPWNSWSWGNGWLPYSLAMWPWPNSWTLLSLYFHICPVEMLLLRRSGDTQSSLHTASTQGNRGMMLKLWWHWGSNMHACQTPCVLSPANLWQEYINNIARPPRCLIVLYLILKYSIFEKFYLWLIVLECY